VNRGNLRGVLSPPSIAVLLRVGLVGLGAVSCGKGARSGDPATAGEPSVGNEAFRPEPPPEPMGPRESALWAAATAGDAEDSMRLVDVIGCEGVRERAAQAGLRKTAIRAMQQCSDFSELPWLVQVATESDELDARSALEAIDDLAARTRRATDPEDADELHAGCVGLLRLARATAVPRARRVLAIRGLRMLSERGCVKRGEIPKDLDPG
jgi:hypothetical protein